MASTDLDINGCEMAEVTNDSQDDSVIDSKRNLTDDAVPERLNWLTEQVAELEQQLLTVERRLTSSSEAPKTALEGVNRTLITSQPYNLNWFSKVRNVFFVMKENPFSVVQLLLMILTIAAISVFGIIRFNDAYNSDNTEYKPIKINGVDDHYNNSELIYPIPAHYILISADTGNLVGLNCTSSDFHTCLKEFFTYLFDIDSDFFKHHLRARCFDWDDPQIPMQLTNVTFSIYIEHDLYFSLMLKLEFGDFDPTWNTGYRSPSTWFFCQVEMGTKFWEDNFDVSFLGFGVSRKDVDMDIYSSLSPEFSASLFLFYESWWADEMGVLVHYFYEESFVDEVSKMDTNYVWGPSEEIVITTIANPTVMHYVSYTRYSYGDWVSDFGGFFTIAMILFFSLTIQVTSFANRNDPLHRRQGILPFISRIYRNAEELAGVRYLLISSFGISVEEYFADEYQTISNGRL